MLDNQITGIYRAWGMIEEVIEVTVRNMIEADLRGIDSHGVGMLPTYNLRRKQGIVDPKGELTTVRDFAATALLDAGNALGHYATTKAMNMACDKAKKFGVGVVTVRRSNHYGAAGVYSTMAADRGMVGVCMTGSSQAAVLLRLHPSWCCCPYSSIPSRPNFDRWLCSAKSGGRPDCPCGAN